MNPYIEIIGASIIIILSYLFSKFAQRTNVPSVLLLIVLGMGLKEGLTHYGINLDGQLSGSLELLGIVGLTMIVLEAALDLELRSDKKTLIVQAFISAFVGLFASSIAIAFIIRHFYEAHFHTCLVYAMPFGIMSSAIIIPSIGGLLHAKKEFLVYESTFSDILGIMVFNFLIGTSGYEEPWEIAGSISLNIVLTVVLSVAVSYVLVILLQRLSGKVKLFLLIAVLMLLYAVGKKMHLSSLLMILTFGVFLNNPKVFFKGRLSRFINEKVLHQVEENFHVITLESAFVVRTFFFVVFGMTIKLETLANLHTATIGLAIIGAIYATRLIVMKVFAGSHAWPGVLIAPRGLITILLSFAIPFSMQIDTFDFGILLYVILGSSLIMSGALMASKEDDVDKLEFPDWEAIDGEIEALRKEHEAMREGNGG